MNKVNESVFTKHRNRLPREAVESLSLELFKSHLDTVQSNLV